jgi:hypothetical protein
MIRALMQSWFGLFTVEVPMGLKIRLVRDVPTPPTSYTFIDPDTGEQRTVTPEEMVQIVTQLVLSGKLEIE